MSSQTLLIPLGFSDNVCSIIKSHVFRHVKSHEFTFRFFCANQIESDGIIKEANKIILSDVAPVFKDKIAIQWRFSFVPNSPVTSYPIRKRVSYKPYVVLCYFTVTQI